MTLNYRSKKYLDMTLAQRLEYDIKCAGRPPTTELQRLAQKENFALFQLAGMLGLITHLRYCTSISPDVIDTISIYLRYANEDIKREQAKRIQRRKFK